MHFFSIGFIIKSMIENNDMLNISYHIKIINYDLVPVQ